MEQDDAVELPQEPHFEIQLKVITPDEQKLGVRQYVLAGRYGSDTEAFLDCASHDMWSQAKDALRERGYIGG